MRGIKFRIFDKYKKYMHKIDALFLDEEMFRVVNYKNEEDVYCYDTSFFSEPMQYTGLKDKNGVEIYEGDIVKIGIDFGYGIEALFGEVIFKDCTFIYRNKSQGDITLNGIDNNSLCEVVGNIYENPELLKD